MNLRGLRKYCDNSTVHGVRYMVHKDLSWTERILWTLLVVAASGGTIAVSLMIKTKFQNSLMSTVVESTNYHISEISFPAVTICNNHRVDFNKFDAALQKYFLYVSHETLPTIPPHSPSGSFLMPPKTPRTLSYVS